MTTPASSKTSRPTGQYAAIRQFSNPASGTLSYLLGCPESRLALLIDPVLDDAPLYLGVLEEMDWRLAYVLETHIHADHVTAASVLRTATGAAIAVGRRSRASGCNLMLDHGDQVELGSLLVDVLHTPGHTPACLTYRWGDRLFTGDCLLPGDGGPTDGPGGDAARLFDTVTRTFLCLADETLIYPGHLRNGRRIGCIGEERGTNPLFSGISRDQFISRRAAAPGLCPPTANALLAINLRCGAPDLIPERIPA